MKWTILHSDSSDGRNSRAMVIHEADEVKIEVCGALGLYQRVFTGTTEYRLQLIKAFAPGTWISVNEESRPGSGAFK